MMSSKHNNGVKCRRSERVCMMEISVTLPRERWRGFYFLQLEDNSLSPGSCRSFEPLLITALENANWCQVFRKKNLIMWITYGWMTRTYLIKSCKHQCFTKIMDWRYFFVTNFGPAPGCIWGSWRHNKIAMYQHATTQTLMLIFPQSFCRTLFGINLCCLLEQYVCTVRTLRILVQASGVSLSEQALKFL